jgi:hypothetical protein
LGKNNTTIGTLDIDNSEADEFGFLTWPRYNMIFRDGGVGGDNFPEEDNGLPLNSHNGTTYFMPYASATETDPAGARMPAADAHAQPDIWYEVWMVANMDDLSAEVYVSGGQFGETARLINIIPNYRNGAALDHDTININTSSDGINFPHATFFDDVFATRGKVLSVPGSPVADTRPKAVGEDAGSTTITLTAESVSDAEVGDTVFDGETPLGIIASISGSVITLEDPLAAALPADTVLSFRFVEVENDDGINVKFVNIATRGLVGANAGEELIGGFVLLGENPQQVLIRGLGPDLTDRGVPGVLADPVITVRNFAGDVVAENDDWGNATDNADVAEAIAAASSDPSSALEDGSADAAILVTLAPNDVYTVVVSSAVAGESGVALVEVFEMDQ